MNTTHPIFFSDRQSLQTYTLSLQHNDQLQCPHCQQVGQFVSHGFVYQTLNRGRQRIVGKRLFCSNRYQHTGCGRTRRLYLADVCPRLHYNLTQLFQFLCALMAGASIADAYSCATGTLQTRQAYRWLHKLYQQLHRFRALLGHRHEPPPLAFEPGSRRLHLLIETGQHLWRNQTTLWGAHYQLHTQTYFL